MVQQNDSIGIAQVLLALPHLLLLRLLGPLAAVAAGDCTALLVGDSSMAVGTVDGRLQITCLTVSRALHCECGVLAGGSTSPHEVVASSAAAVTVGASPAAAEAWRELLTRPLLRVSAEIPIPATTPCAPALPPLFPKAFPGRTLPSSPLLCSQPLPSPLLFALLQPPPHPRNTPP